MYTQTNILQINKFMQPNRKYTDERLSSCKVKELTALIFIKIIMSYGSSLQFFLTKGRFQTPSFLYLENKYNILIYFEVIYLESNINEHHILFYKILSSTSLQVFVRRNIYVMNFYSKKWHGKLFKHCQNNST